MSALPSGTSLIGSFDGATVDELRTATPVRRVLGLVDQRRRFPHHGRIDLNAERLVLGSWRTLLPDDIARVSRRFIPEYGRFEAGGARGGFPSLGNIARLGAPLLLELKSNECIVALIDFSLWSGANDVSSWLPALERFVARTG